MKNRSGTNIFSDLPSLPKLPFRVLVMAELAPREDELNKSSSNLFSHTEVDKNSFDEVMERIAGQVNLSVRNRLSDRPKYIQVMIPLRGIKSFRPETVAETVPALKDLIEVRRMLVLLRDGKLSCESFQERISEIQGNSVVLGSIKDAVADAHKEKQEPRTRSRQPTAPVPEPSKPTGGKDSALDSLLGMVDLPAAAGGVSLSTQTPAEPASSMLDRMISMIKLARHDGTLMDTAPANRIISDLDDAIGIQLNEILHHPEFRRLESTWRGVRFLVQRTDFREPVRIELLAASKDQLIDVFRSEIEGMLDNPVSVVLADYSFDRSQHNMETLQEIAALAETLQVPFISSVGLSFLGLNNADEFAGTFNLEELFKQPEYMKWRSFRQSGSSRWISLAFNRFPLRTPYGPSQQRVRNFGYQESISGTGDHVWGNPVWALGALLTSSFAGTGWPTKITGIKSGGRLEDLLLHEVKTKDGHEVRIPLEIIISGRQQDDLTDNGINPFVCRLNSDTAWFASATTAHIPERYPADPEETTWSIRRSSLPFQMFASRVSQYLSKALAELPAGLSPEKIEEYFIKVLYANIGTGYQVTHGAIEIRIGDIIEERPGYSGCSVVIRPDLMGHEGLAPLEMSFRIPTTA